MSRRVVDEVLRLNETHGFLRGLTALVGFPQASVLYDRDPRVSGDGKYNRFTGSVRIGLNGIVGFSRYPLQIITWIGLITFAFAAVLALVYLALRLAGVDIPWGNPTLVMIISFFSGIQLLSLGVIGEYVGRIYDEVKRRPLFVVDALEGFERPMAEFEGEAPARERSSG
jgi:dolichol-phosphate mannosyltransferase